MKIWNCRTEPFHRMLLLLPLLALIATAVVHTSSASEQVSHIRHSSLLWPYSTHSSDRCRGCLLRLITHSVGLLWTKDRSVAKTCIHNTTLTKRQTSMGLAGFEPVIPASERLQTYALDREATETGDSHNTTQKQTDAFAFGRTSLYTLLFEDSVYSTFVWVRVSVNVELIQLRSTSSDLFFCFGDEKANLHRFWDAEHENGHWGAWLATVTEKNFRFLNLES